jgi:signal transduction histidine kinase
VREEERIHIAREIHDELGQALTGLKFDIGKLAKSACRDDPETSEKIQTLSQSIDRINNSVRRIASGLRPEVLDEIGLSAAIEWQAREFQRRTGVRCTVEIEPGFADPDKERSTALFRIFQELLTNVARHANATRVSARLADDDGLSLVVEDNGRGVRSEELEGNKSLGFLGLRERVLAFGGSIDVRGEEGKGTKVSVLIPNLQQQPTFHA